MADAAPWEDYQQPAQQPVTAGPWSDYQKPEDDSSHPFLNHFVNAVGDAVIETTARHIAQTGEVPSLGSYFKQAAKSTGQGLEGLTANLVAPILSPDQKQDLENAGVYNQGHVAADKIRNNGQPLTSENYKNLLADGIMQSPVGQFSGAAWSMLMAPLAPLFEVGVNTAKNMGVSEGTLNLGTAGLTVLGVAGAGGVKENVAAGLEHNVIGSPESVFMGHEEPHPIMNEVAHKAAESTQPTITPTNPPVAPTKFNANVVARNLQPELFKEYDSLAVKQETLRSQIQDLAITRDENIRQKYTAEINELQAKIDDAKARGKNTLYSSILENKIAERDQELQSAPYTPEMTKLQKQIMKADYRRRDLAPDVYKAYQDANEYRPQENTEAKPITENTPKPIEQPNEQLPKEIIPIDNQIAPGLIKQLQDLGRPPAEAKASAALVSAHYQAISDLGWAKGTPQEIYEKHSPLIVKGAAKQAKQISELSQKPELKQKGARGSFLRATSDFPGGIIGLRPTADASTLVHEMGHAWLDEMERFAKEPDAPQSLMNSHKAVRDWLGAKEGQDITRGQHEKFARGFERYLMEGVAPSRGLAQVFHQFKEWLTKIYQAVKNLRSPLTDEIRGVFDKMLAANPEKTVYAPDHEPGKLMADIHEADAKTTEHKEKGKVGDNIEKEIDAIAKLHNPEVANAIKAAETGRVSETVAGDTGVATAGERPGYAIAPEEPSAVTNGGSTATAGSIGESGKSGKSGRSEQPLIDKAGNIRLELLTKEADIRDLIRQMADENGGYATAQGEVVTQRDISDFADSLGIEEGKMNIEKLKELTRVDGIPLAFRIRAARVALKQSADAVQEMMKSAGQWTEDDAAKYAEEKSRHIMIAQTVSGITAEWGRAGHAFRDISGEQMKAAQDITEFLQSSTGRTYEELKREAQLGAKLKDSQQTSKYIKDTTQPTFVDKMLWYRNNCLLSGPITHGVYMEANLVNLALRPFETGVAAKLGEISGAKEGAVKGEGMEMLYALSNPNAFRNAAESWKEHVAVLPGAQGKKYTSIAFNQQLIEGHLGVALHQVSRSINALHSFIYTMAYEQNIAGASYRMAIREGLEPGTDIFAKRLADLRANQPPEMMDYASNEAFNEVNMGKSGPVLGKLSLFLNSNPLTRFMFPFVKMEMNVLKNTWLERTPLGLFAKDIRGNLLGANGEAVRDMQRAKIIATTGIAGTLFTLAGQYVNADGPTDPSKNRVWRLTHTPNSIQIGDTSFSLKGLGRIGALLKFSAGIKESVAGWEGDDGDHIARALATHVSHSFDSSFTDGIKNTIDFTSSPGEHAKQFIQNFATQFLPFSVGLGQVAHQVDPFLRDTKTESEGALGSVDGIVKAAMARIPEVSKLLEPRYDMFGNSIAANAAYHDLYKDDPTVERMNALHIGVGNLQPKIFGVSLNDIQYADYSRQAGILTKETLDRLITPDFSNYSLQMQVQAIHDVISASREQAKQQIIMKYPEVRDKAIEFSRTAHGH